MKVRVKFTSVFVISILFFHFVSGMRRGQVARPGVSRRDVALVEADEPQGPLHRPFVAALIGADYCQRLY